jgi:HEAT repeat protein
MTTYPALTISLLSQLTNQELQSNYLNHLNLTTEITSLLSQMTDKDLALRIVNLALEVDLCLGASLTSSIDPTLQKIVADGIDRLEIPIYLKIELWRRTKSKAALAYLQDLFIFKNQYRQKSIYDYDPDRDDIVRMAMDAIIDIDRNLAAALLIEALYDNRSYASSAAMLSELATVAAEAPMLTELIKPETIEAVSDLFHRSCNDIHRHAIDILGKIGTESAITKIRDILHDDKSRWLHLAWIQGLGVVGETPMVEQLLDLLYFADEYIERTPDEPIERENEEYYEREANELRCEAILGIERLGGDLAFELLHRSLYWTIDSNEDPNPLEAITQALFRLDRDLASNALECAIHSDDPAIRMRVATVLGRWYISIDDRQLSILLDALNDPDPEVDKKITDGIRTIVNFAQNTDGRIPISVDLTPQILNLAATNPQIANYYFPDYLATRDIGDRLVQKELIEEVDLSFINLLNITQLDRLISDVELTDLLKQPDDCIADVRARAIVQMGKIGDDSVLTRLISLLEDPEYSARVSAVEGIVEIGSVATIPILLSLATNPELVMTLIWYLETLRKEGRTATGLDLLLADRRLASNFLDIAEKTIVDIAVEESPRSVMTVLCLGAIGSSDEAVLAIDKIIKNGYHHYHFALRSLARIDNELAIHKISAYLFDNNSFANLMRGELRQVCRLGIIPHLWTCQRNNYSSALDDLIATTQTRAGLYNPDFSDRSHPLFEPSYPRLRHILLANTTTEREIPSSL